MDLEEYQSARNGHLAANLSHHAKWQLTGSDRVRYLNGQSTCDVSKLAVGQSAWGAITSIKGKMEGDLRVAATRESLLLDAHPSLSESLFNRLSKYIIADDVEIHDVSGDWKLYHFIGTQTPTFDPVEGHHLLKSNRFGVDGHDLWLPAGAPNTPPCAPESVWDTIRIENGVPQWGIDMSAGNLAPEMPFERLGGLSYSKGCYIGQEVIARIKSIGHVNKQLCLLHSKELFLPLLPQACLSERKNVGTAGSGCLSPLFGGTCLLATVARQQSSPGTELEIEGKSYFVIESKT